MAQGDVFDQLIPSSQGEVRVRCRPRGAALRDLTRGKDVDIVNWFSILPDVLSLVGWLLHMTVYRRAWVVTAEPGGPDLRPFRLEGLSRSEAEAAFEQLVDWIRRGGSAVTFRPAA